MFTISNLKKHINSGWCYLSCDFAVTGMKSPFEEKTMWVAVEEQNTDMLADNVYDAFVLVPLILGMYYKQDVYINGKISPRLYHNVQHYLMNIFDRFSKRTSPINFSVDGFDTVEQVGNLIGTGFSCGVDCLTTICDNYINEANPNFRINSLFFLDSGTNGEFEGTTPNKKFQDRVALNKSAAEELGLPLYLVRSNFHAFMDDIGVAIYAYLGMYSCVLSLQRCLKKYYASSTFSYDETARFSECSRDYDIEEYGGPFMLHLLSTENFELIDDGCQYTRAEKIERISDWCFAQKHLNVCASGKVIGAHNCSFCRKCMWTLIPLEAMGKLENFKGIFDLEAYHKNAFRWKCRFLALYGKDALGTSIIEYAKKCGMKLPPRWVAICVKFMRHWLWKFGILK